ncbi:MAG: hypothetical protein J6U00_02795 [Ruminococcus sp.]|uniref:hypothetical protein n=1 Tax=Ruminococcus sp. TaxID=41978 RepID=UPI001B0A7610|nr:hypothetical protein [Ruminococcus sp.]MBO7472921.1 hypothetical protein [Ruminococcus sp.]
MKVEEYYCLTLDTACAPNYTPDPADRCIQAYYALNNDVILIGGSDPWLIYWLSVTKLDTDAINRQIVDYVLHMEPTVFGHRSNVLEKTEYTEEQLRSFYSATVKQEDDIIGQLKAAKQRCRRLEADGKLIPKIKQHRRLLTGNVWGAADFYRKNEKLITRLKSMKYLYCSDDPKVRELYEQLDQCCANLYNAYMSEARG